MTREHQRSVIRQVETGLFDGWYYTDEENLRAVLAYWQELFPEYTHDILRWNDPAAPGALRDDNMLNRSAEYLERRHPGARSRDT